MTIQKGQPWGETIVVPASTRDVPSDRDLANGSQHDLHIVSGGDIFASLGSPQHPHIGQQKTKVWIDALRCTITTETQQGIVLASSSISIGTWCRWGIHQYRYVCLTNGGIVNGRHIAPRAHPNDGFVDVMTIEPNMPIRQRVEAMRRSRTGTHVPHPNISLSRLQTIDIRKQCHHEKLTIDGRTIGSWHEISVEVLPDYWQVIV